MHVFILQTLVNWAASTPLPFFCMFERGGGNLSSLECILYGESERDGKEPWKLNPQHFRYC